MGEGNPACRRQGWGEKGRWLMNRKQLKQMDTRIKKIKKAAEELKALGGRTPAVDRNASRILASVKMLEINISDIHQHWEI